MPCTLRMRYRQRKEAKQQTRTGARTSGFGKAMHACALAKPFTQLAPTSNPFHSTDHACTIPCPFYAIAPTLQLLWYEQHSAPVRRQRGVRTATQDPAPTQARTHEVLSSIFVLELHQSEPYKCCRPQMPPSATKSRELCAKERSVCPFSSLQCVAMLVSCLRPTLRSLALPNQPDRVDRCS